MASQNLKATLQQPGAVLRGCSGREKKCGRGLLPQTSRDTAPNPRLEPPAELSPNASKMGFIFGGKVVKYRSVFCACMEFFIVYIYMNKLLFVFAICAHALNPPPQNFFPPNWLDTSGHCLHRQRLWGIPDWTAGFFGCVTVLDPRLHPSISSQRGEKRRGIMELRWTWWVKIKNRRTGKEIKGNSGKNTLHMAVWH